jgi:hypothetical protein
MKRYHIRSLGYSPINVNRLALNLKNYPIQADANMLLDGFTNGFKLYYHGPRMSLDTTNLKSVLFNTDVAISKVKTEILEGRIAGPFNARHIYNLRCSPIGLVPKKNGGLSFNNTYIISLR